MHEPLLYSDGARRSLLPERGGGFSLSTCPKEIRYAIDNLLRPRSAVLDRFSD